MSRQRKRLIEMYEQIIVTERKVELPQQTLTLSFKYSTYEGRHHLRINSSKHQYILDHFILLKLEKYYEVHSIQQKYVPDQALWRNFSHYFDYEPGRPLFIRDLNLKISPFPMEYYQKGTKEYEACSNKENTQLKCGFNYEMTISHLAFRVLSFLKQYQAGVDNRPSLSLREKIIILILEENDTSPTSSDNQEEDNWNKYQQQKLENLRAAVKQFSEFANSFQKKTLRQNWQSESLKRTGRSWFVGIDPSIDLQITVEQIDIKQRAPQVGFYQMIESIWLEMELGLRWNNSYQMIAVLQEENKVIMHQRIPKHLMQVFQILPVGLTHFRISKYIRSNKCFRRFSPKQTPYSRVADIFGTMMTNLETFLNNFYHHYLHTYMRDFEKFLKDGRAFQKYQLLNKKKLHCQRNIASEDVIRLDPRDTSIQNINLSNFGSQISKDHGKIGNKEVVLNYPPQFFMRIIEEIQRYYSAMDSIPQHMIQFEVHRNSVFGAMFDNCCAKIVTHFTHQIYFGDSSYHLKSHQTKYFYPFQPNQINVDIKKKLKDVLDYLEDHNQWISAYPRHIVPNFRKKDSDYFDSRRCIDILFMKKVGQGQYQLRTIDFALTYPKHHYMQQCRKAQTFFVGFFQSAKKSGLKFTLQHFIVSRESSMTVPDKIQLQDVEYSITCNLQKI